MNQTLETEKKVDFINDIINKKKLSKLILKIYEEFGAASATEVSNSLKDLGFSYATKAAVTLSIEDLTVPEAKKDLISNAEKELEESHKRFERGEITEVERYNKVIDTWSQTNEDLTEKVVDGFDKLNPVYMMAFSGARGNVSQVRQLVGMRGLMAGSQGQIIDLPIKSNFKEGLSVTEYIISSYGARKGLVDTALKTADSGYLTRRLVDVAQDVTIRGEDCGTNRFIEVHSIYEGEKLVLGVSERAEGRFAAEDVIDPDTNQIIVNKNEVINRERIELIAASKVKEIKVRSPLTCELPYGLCKKCYGWSLASNRVVDNGEAVGIIAAQSIGEPGTQLTMRTFHTGGALEGGSKTDQIIAPEDGELTYSIAGKDHRTRYGDQVTELTKDGKIKVGGSEIKVSAGSHIKYVSGQKVSKGEVIGNYAQPPRKGAVERITKDLVSDYAGQIIFDGFTADERTDRQGNISRTATKSGVVWVMQGDVYNLPPASKLIVEDGQEISSNDVLSETLIVSERGGEVRYSEDIVIEEVKQGKEKIKRLSQGKKLSVVIARVGADNAALESSSQGNSWITKDGDSEETYTLKVVPDESIQNKSVIAELVDDGALSVASAGEIRYQGLEVDESKVITQTGKVLFVPEEVHYVSKDINLKQVDHLDKVSAGQEIVEGVFTQIDGYVDFKIDNDIIHEITVRPGEMHDIEEYSELKVSDGDIVEPGAEIYPGITADETKLITVLEQVDEEDPEKKTYKLIVRPIELIDVEPRTVAFQGYSTDPNIALLAVTQMLYKDGEKIRNLNGGPITKTSLILTMSGDFLSLKGKLEHIQNHEGKEELQIVVQDNIVLRREQDNNVTQLLVDDRDHIAPGAAVAKTQVLANTDGVVSLSTQEENRLLLITGNDLVKQETTAKPTVKVGGFIKQNEKVGGQTNAICSGQVVSVEPKAVVIRRGRPYLISTGAILQCDEGHLVQRGDQLAALIFERFKTGDIVQGLPRVEELLEGRKPKDSAILAEIDATIKIVQNEDDIKRVMLVSGEAEVEVPVPPGLNLLVDDGETVTKGQALTDGPMNPHDILALLGLEALQQYLLDGVQKVYRGQGVDISDKHVEVIIRQMTRKIKIQDSGDTTLLPGELVEVRDVKEEIERAKQTMENPESPTYLSVLLGITKASLNTESFISAASFQETTRILSEASIEGKRDWLRGLKENVIIGRLIPAGTGAIYSQAMNADASKSAMNASQSLAV